MPQCQESGQKPPTYKVEALIHKTSHENPKLRKARNGGMVTCGYSCTDTCHNQQQQQHQLSTSKVLPGFLPGYELSVLEDPSGQQP
jgi:hypothetical protein